MEKELFGSPLNSGPAPDTLDILYKAGDVASQSQSPSPRSRLGPEMGSRETIYKLPCAGCGKFGGTSFASSSLSASSTSSRPPAGRNQSQTLSPTHNKTSSWYTLPETEPLGED